MNYKENVVIWKEPKIDLILDRISKMESAGFFIFTECKEADIIKNYFVHATWIKEPCTTFKWTVVQMRPKLATNSQTPWLQDDDDVFLDSYGF